MRDGIASDCSVLAPAEAKKFLPVSDPKGMMRSISWFRHSVMGRLQLAGGTMLLALMATNVLGLLPGATAAHHGLEALLKLIAAASMVPCLAVIFVSRNASTRLNRLTEGVLALTESYSKMAPSSAGRGDEIDQLAQALNVLHEITRRAMVSEANLDAAVENMVEGIVMIAADGKVALHNQRLLAIFGLPPMNAVGMPRAEFNAMLVAALHWPQSAQDYLQKQLAAVRSDGNYRVFDVELPHSRVLRYSASMLADGNVMSYIEDISEQRAAAASILRLAHYDTLTELPNRALFQERLASAVEAAERDSAARATLLVCDLDRFKAVNDTFGHPVGDELLRQATRRMRAQVRADNILARLGGDEFAIIYLSRNDSEGAEGLARRLVACLEQPFEIQGHEVSIGISIGIAIATVHATSADDLMIRADLALYAAKQGGRSMHRVYEPAMSMFANEYGCLETALRKAIDNDSLHLHYQPQVDLRTRRIVGFEALVRWDLAERGPVSPDTFIPLAEKVSLIVPLGAWVLRRACNDAFRWGDDIMVAVNVAPQQLRSEGFVEMVAEVLAKSGLKPARLELEITETAPLHDDEAILTVLRKLATIGVRVSMDDFGTGNTGLSYLHKFHFDTLKIDQSFVTELGNAKEAELIVNAIVELSVSLNVQTIAEGIETEQQAAILRSMNCNVGQGFLFGHPAPLSVANGLILEQNIAASKGNLLRTLSLMPQSD
jgi:diguanylate cyclase (GGDEF)-like protein